MADYPVPVRAVAYIFYAGLPSQANALLFQTNPTIAAGDFKISIDGGALANLATLPVVTPTGGKGVKFALSGTEMTGDNITIVCSDVAGSEWCDQIFNIQTSANGIADLATAVNMTEANADLDEIIATLGTAGDGLTAVPTATLAAAVESGVSVLQMLRAIGAATVGNYDSGTSSFKAVANSGTTRITTVLAANNRTNTPNL